MHGVRKEKRRGNRKAVPNNRDGLSLPSTPAYAKGFRLRRGFGGQDGGQAQRLLRSAHLPPTDVSEHSERAGADQQQRRGFGDRAEVGLDVSEIGIRADAARIDERRAAGKGAVGVQLIDDRFLALVSTSVSTNPEMIKRILYNPWFAFGLFILQIFIVVAISAAVMRLSPGAALLLFLFYRRDLSGAGMFLLLRTSRR